MNYTNKEKIVLGKIFKYLRISQSRKATDVIKNICSEKTYFLIEKGEIIKTNSFYTELVNVFNEKYYTLSELFDWLNQFVLEMYEACDYMNLIKIEELYRRYNLFFSDKNKYIVYRQYYKILNYLFRYYKQHQYLDHNELRDMLEMIKFVDNDLKYLMVEVMHVSNWNYVVDYKLFDLVYKYIGKQKENEILYHYLHYKYYLKGEFSTSLEILTISSMKIKSDNNYRQFLNLRCLFNQYANMDIIKAEKLIPELLNKQEKCQIDDSIKSSTYYNLGMFFYQNQKYEKAYDFYKKSYSLNKSNTKTLLMMCACARELGKELPEELINHKCNDKNYRKDIFDYYILLKKQCDYIALEEMILYRITESLKHFPSYQPYWAIFEKELYRLCQITKKYSMLHRYLKIMNKYNIKK